MKIYEVEPFAYGFVNSPIDDSCYRIACAHKYVSENYELKINPDDWFAGTCGSYHLAMGMGRYGTYANREILQYRIEKYPELKDELEDLFDKYLPYDKNYAIRDLRTEKESLLSDYKACWGSGAGHANPDFAMLLKLGTNGLRKKIAKFRKIHIDKNVFYDSLLIVLNALDTFGDRYKALAEKMLPEANSEDAVVLKRIIKAFETIPREEPKDFFEACQMFWLSFGFLDIDSPGLFDTFMWPYYKDHDKEDRYECLRKIWKLFHKTRTWNLCISGSDEFGNDMTNDLTYDVLRVAREFKVQTPNITMRVHENTPDELWAAAAETLATGIGMPAIYNDEVVCTALESIGIPASDSHLYCMNGCNQIDIFGKSHMGLEDGEICIAKALEYALANGYDHHAETVLGKETGDAKLIKSFDELMNVFFEQIRYLADTATSISNREQEFYSKNIPMPWHSLIIQGCIEKGINYKSGGPIYGHGQILTEGLSDAVDSLVAIKHFVFEEKKYSMSELVDALDNDFEGFEELHKDFSSYDKFGNDSDAVDNIYAEVSDYVYRYLQTIKTFRGGIFTVGCSTFNRAARYGGMCGALPNGKKMNETNFAESIGAVPGSDKNGPTALLNSVLKCNQYLAGSGNVLQLKFDKNQFNTPAGKAAYISLAKTYFRLGGQTLQINVVSREELLDAKIHPEKHQDLIVRVGGFSDYFNHLSPELQDNIIARTEIAL